MPKGYFRPDCRGSAGDELKASPRKDEGEKTPAGISASPCALYPAENTINIRWSTTSPVKTRLSYFKKSEGAEGRVIIEGDKKTVNHSVTIRGLEEFTEYMYSVDGFERICQFKSAGAGSTKKFSFIIFGDPHSSKDYGSIAGKAGEYAADFAVCLGDTVQTPSDELFERFLNLSAPLFEKTAVSPVIGNHEYRFQPGGNQNNGNDTNVYDNHIGYGGKNYYSFEYGRIMFAALNFPDKGMLAKNDEQLKWLDSKLQEARRKDLKVILLHHCPFFTSTRISWAQDGILIPDFLREYNDLVAASFAGHIHTYERSLYPGRNGIDYITTGGAGVLYEYPVNEVENRYQVNAADILHFMLVTVNERDIDIQVIDINGAVRDVFSIRK